MTKGSDSEKTKGRRARQPTELGFPVSSTPGHREHSDEEETSPQGSAETSRQEELPPSLPPLPDEDPELLDSAERAVFDILEPSQVTEDPLPLGPIPDLDEDWPPEPEAVPEPEQEDVPGIPPDMAWTKRVRPVSLSELVPELKDGAPSRLKSQSFDVSQVTSVFARHRTAPGAGGLPVDGPPPAPPRMVQSTAAGLPGEPDQATSVWPRHRRRTQAMAPDVESNRDNGAGRELALRETVAGPALEAVGQGVPGRVIAGKYEIVRPIGSGGMARVFEVVHKDLGRHFALKIIHTALSGDPRMRERFYQEARVASSLEHPNIVQITDFGEAPGLGAFIVMEFLHGETLHERLRREGRLRLPLACDMALQVAEALYFIHQRNIVHCDIKSENIFLCDPPAGRRRKPVVKLLDFGLSTTKALTMSGSLLPLSEVGGTPAYMAPERIKRKPPTPSMDIYSLGVLLYEMITGTLPFEGTLDEVLVAHLEAEPDPPSKRLGEPLDERVDELILKALAKDPKARQKDMASFIFELRTLMDMLGMEPRHRPRPQRPQPRDTRSRRSETVFDLSPLPMFLLDGEGRFLVANAAFCTFVSATEDSIRGRHLSETRLGQLCPALLEDLARSRNGETTQRLLTIPRRNRPELDHVLIWLVPSSSPSPEGLVAGIVHPFCIPSSELPA